MLLAQVVIACRYRCNWRKRWLVDSKLPTQLEYGDWMRKFQANFKPAPLTSIFPDCDHFNISMGLHTNYGYGHFTQLQLKLPTSWLMFMDRCLGTCNVLDAMVNSIAIGVRICHEDLQPVVQDVRRFVGDTLGIRLGSHGFRLSDVLGVVIVNRLGDMISFLHDKPWVAITSQDHIAHDLLMVCRVYSPEKCDDVKKNLLWWEESAGAFYVSFPHFA
ncbi:hypothetical protein L218DRAFT_1007868 [Marasmius fiardii PR-910]|nr:hypothetical protein L218DRAFT_1007868 [Marasmius fiardii PR-910]